MTPEELEELERKAAIDAIRFATAMTDDSIIDFEARRRELRRRKRLYATEEHGQVKTAHHTRASRALPGACKA